MYIKLKILFLYLLKGLGLFTLARALNKNKIRIICYHGISVEDEHMFIPSNFITFKSMKKKLSLLKNKGYKFISLTEAVKQIQGDEKMDEAVVITFDDGFRTILDEALPWLIKNNIPTTAYITTYYSQRPYPIFRIAFQYLVWKTNLTTLEVQGKTIDLTNNTSVWDFILASETKLNAKEQNDLLDEIQKIIKLELSPNIIRSFSIVNESEVKKLDEDSINIELHTHRHLFPISKEICEREIKENKDVLGPLTQSKFQHFCYPSGLWDPSHYEILREQKITSATTCDPGLVDKNSNLLSLPRIIESEAMSTIQFEAEIVGIGDWLRFFKK